MPGFDSKLAEALAAQSAPAVITAPAPMPEAEKTQKAEEAAATPLWEKQHAADEIDKKLKRIELTTGSSGAFPMTPRNMMLDAREVQALNPSLHIRWVNVNNTDKVTTHVANGYRRLSESQGGRSIGNLVLMYIPREVHLQRRAELRKISNTLLAQDKQAFEGFIEGMAAAMQAKFGVSISPAQLGGIIRGE